jgi:L-threonylcarbamoyladenylate synthase
VQSSNNQTKLDEALQVLQFGGVVVFPTDTLYGLGANVFSEQALRRVYAVKGRQTGLGLPVFVAEWEQVRYVVGDVTGLGGHLAQMFWPGPLTLVFLRSRMVSDLVTGGRDTVAVRMPDHWVPRELASRLGGAITGTSANRSGKANVRTVEEVEVQLGQDVDYIVRCGPAPSGEASTLVDVTGKVPLLLRKGALPFDRIMKVCE